LLAQSPENIVVTFGSSFRQGMPARGSIGTIFCTGLNLSGTVKAEGVPLPWSLSGVSLTIGGANAPLFSVSALDGYQQINFQVPQEAAYAADGSVPVTITQNGKTGLGAATTQEYLYPPTPGDFFTAPNSAYGAFQHASDYSVVTVENPARPGETIIGYLTGLAGTTPVVPTGQASPFSPLAIVPQSPVPRLNQYTVFPGTATIGFLGLAPGLVGVYQLNFTLATNTPVGALQIQLERHWCNDACLFGGQGWEYSKSVLLPVR
jgi:uncharacterized protein (TIGR03437 family)